MWIQSISSDSENYRYGSINHLIQEFRLILSINHNSHGGLTLWKISGQKNQDKVWGATLHKIMV